MAKEGSKKKVGSIIADVIVAIVVIFATIITVMVISTTQNESKTPNLFGYAVMSVQTDSMDVEGGFAVGDMIIVKMLDDEEINNLEVGDVVSFSMPVDGLLIVNTHRIVEKDVRGGIPYFRTKGDKISDGHTEAPIDDTESSYDNILGVWTGVKITGLGKVFDFLKSQLGFFLCILLPIALFFLWQLYKLIVAINDNKKAKALEELSENEEEIKKKAIEEYLAQQKASEAQAEEKQE